ncbi:ATP-binding cassette domain-containing protein [Actinopolyspora mortivallis]|uniref:Daunorubicin/doxorubicin resistance ABC transporter ATP-binding protein DrrA n=1 Tax=Actinopolyspora mortivallis TaxID=33906 RepID=A0A2T0GWE0_ACTMO|nr:ATP-binding cassette domain-containing protein [Actinopolyspora mortivallis]PRW63430.1 daunorubicin/doxorubicin resistance ABC transporter ATP-binding protein DrrA [Actinopolyspora mortivallis]
MTAASPPAISTEGLVKNFGPHRALDGLDLRAERGQVLGVLGPNGAGKTTAVRILATLLRADAGEARVAGHDVRSEPHAVRRSIGLSGQYSAVDHNLTGYENLHMVARLHDMSHARARERARDLLEHFRLREAADRPAKGYSGGMRRRLDLAAALVSRPSVVILDEPTTGLDPRGRMETWQVVSELVGDGTTVLLTTQYLEEADALADDIVVIDHGRVIAEGSSEELKSLLGGERLDVVAARARDLPALVSALEGVGSGEVAVDERSLRARVAVETGSRALIAAVRRLDALEVEVQDVGLHRPTLDDVFLTLTGRVTEDSGRAEESADDDGTAGTPSRAAGGR